MTREEQNQIADFVRSYIHEIITESGADKNAHTNEVLRKVAEGIEALSAEPCEDCISRKAVNTLVDELARAISDERCCMSRGRATSSIMQDILDLPSVTPKQKMGHWVPTDKAWAGINKCSICGYRKDAHHKMDFCPSCGAKMAESEDKK